MRFWVKILLTGVVIYIIFFSAVFVFIKLEGKTILTRQLENLTHKKVSVGYFGVVPPLKLQIKDLNIQDVAVVNYISVSPSILSLIAGSLIFNDIKIVKPEVNFEYASAKIAEQTEVKDSPTDISTVPAPVSNNEKNPLRFIFKRMVIKDGILNLIDRSVGNDGVKVTVKELNLRLTNLYLFPRSVIMNFEIKGKIPWQDGSEEGKIEADGWINLFKKDIQASLKIEGIDGISLYPYYSKWVDLEKARIEKAKLNFTSNIRGLDNDVTAECRLELADIVFKPRSAEEQQEKAERIAIAVLDILKSLDKGKIVLDFTIKTKMDRPEFGFSDIRTAFEEKLTGGRKSASFGPQDFLLLPVKFVEGAVKGTADVTKAVVAGTIGVGTEMKKAVEGAFKKEKKETK